MNKFDGVQVFTSGLDSSHLGFGIAIIMDNSLNNLSVLILGLYAGALSVVWFSQAGKINSLIAKTVNKFSFIILGGDFNENRARKCASFKNLVNAVMDGSVADVENYFDTNHKAVSAFSDFKDTTAANTAMFLDEFETAMKFSDLDAMVFTKKSFKLHNLEILVSKIVKTSYKTDFNRFKSLLRCWVSIDSDKAFVVWDLVSSGVSLNCVYSALCGVRRSYRASKLAESLQAEKSSIRLAIKRRIESFVINKDHTIHSVLECPFCKVVLDYLVSDGGLLLDSVEVKNKVDGIMKDWMRKKTMLKSVPNLWQHQYLPLDYVNDNAFSGVINAISLDNLIHMIKDLPDGKAAGLFGILNELWKHCDGSVLSLLLDLLNICLVCESDVLTNTKLIALIETAHRILSKLLSAKISSTYSLFNVLCGNNFSVFKGITTQSPIFAIGLVVENTLEKDHELWLVLQNMCKVYDSVIIDFGLINRYQKIFYDPLLCEVKKQKSSLTLFLAAGAFVDDTIWRVSNASLSINGLLISIAYRKKSHQYLGIYLLSEGFSKPSLVKMYMNVKFFVNLALKKAILNKQFFYLVLAVLQLIVNYRIQFNFISRNVYIKWDTLIKRRLRLKTCLSRDFPNKALYHSFLYGLKSFEQLQTECKMASVLCFSNAGGVLGYLFNHRSLNFQVLDVVRIFLDYNMSLDNFSVSAFHFSGGTPISIAMDVCSLGTVSRLSQCLSSTNLGVVSVYTNESLRDLGSCEMKCGAAAYFSDLDLSISAKVGGLVSSTMVELQAIALALECVLSDSLVVVYSDSQAALDVCVTESALVSSNFHNHCWMEQHSIINFVKGKQLDVFWHKVKKHSGVIGNECADELASLAVNSFLALPVLVKKRFIKANRMVVFENICYLARKIFRSHSDFHMVTSFTSKSMASLHFYFLKALHHCLLIAIWKCLYSKIYSSVLCLHCGEVESSDHFFVCTFNSDAHIDILKSYLAKWYCVSGLGLHSSRVSQVLSLCTSDDILYTTMSKNFVFRDWVQKASFILGDAKVVGKFIVDFVQELGAAHHMDIWLVRAKYRALMKKGSLIPLDGFVYPVTCGLSCMFFAGVIRLLGIAKTVGVCFGFHKHCCFFSGIDSMVSVLIDL
ncbi:hypothetical protein G9A89_018187 [Geosiphon pyriformis]|nr:hypothetical protein G9A89_018187 [Geosiphon pyriformis]